MRSRPSVLVLVVVGLVLASCGVDSSDTTRADLVTITGPAEATSATAEEDPAGQAAAVFTWDEAESLDEWLTDEEMAGLLGELATEFGFGDPEADTVHFSPSDFSDGHADLWVWTSSPIGDGFTVQVQRPYGGGYMDSLEHEGLPEGVTASVQVWGSREYKGPNSDEVFPIGVEGPSDAMAGEESDRPLQPWEARVASFILGELGWLDG